MCLLFSRIWSVRMTRRSKSPKDSERFSDSLFVSDVQSFPRVFVTLVYDRSCLLYIIYLLIILRELSQSLFCFSVVEIELLSRISFWLYLLKCLFCIVTAQLRMFIYCILLIQKWQFFWWKCGYLINIIEIALLLKWFFCDIFFIILRERTKLVSHLFCAHAKHDASHCIIFLFRYAFYFIISWRE